MACGASARRLISWLTIGALTAFAAPAFAQFVSTGDRTRSLLEGNWQSCREPDGRYSERIYDNNLPGIGPFELHFGPYHEFALFRGAQDDHREHSSPENLLSPFNVEVASNRARQTWETAGLRLQVSLGGGGRDDCESWFITLTRGGQPASD
jgi:hypothetical protein